ncbi:Ubiquitin conjugation factor E4, core [Cynara cardunculus var. scolymus]|uniref:Ubiquitin conjugation factor E4, core n=1 Tax=Cynara cardunculus var. scolymus TaxID=59895 RepID=A0A103XL53_CYNCS|nr:Ubiquitin conjugation factor E4, core [Cynara cardunculus var. scolymus]
MSTTTAKPQRSPEEIEDIILRKIFLVTLVDSMGNDTRVVYLEMTAAEILSEGGELRLSRDLMERVLVDRLSGNFTSAEPPFQYLIGIFRRAHEEGKKITNMKDKSVRAQMELVVNQAKKLAVSYCRIHLGNPDMFPDSERTKSNVSPLLPLIFSEVSSSLDAFGGSSGVASCPPGFLDELFRDSDYDTMEPILKQLYEDLRGIVLKCSALGNFQQPLRALMYLISFPVGARALVNHQWWIPKGAYLNGRVIEMTSILGPFFHVSALPDQTIFKGQPDVGQQCFSESSTRRPADLLSSFTTIKTVMNNLYDGLAEILRSLLKNTSTRENVLQYIAEVINKNASRAHIQVDPISSASSGMFVNLSAVMLRLCEPFLDANSSKKDKIDPKYVFYGSRLDFKELTALHASSEEVSEWLNKNNPTSASGGENMLLDSQETTSSGSGTGLLQNNNMASSQRDSTNYSFICECFFMTARVLNLGLLKAFSDFKHLVQEQAPSPRLVQDIARLEKEIEAFTQEKLCYEAQILRDGGLLQQALSFYQLMVVWLVGRIGGFKMPLPQSCPLEFACMPEHFVEDDDFMNFIIMFMASPEYIRNPYLRAKMVEVLNCWMPRRSGSSSVTSSLFEGHQLSVQYLVKNLLKLYVDIEFTGSHTQFYDKFNIRHNIAELLEYLWQILELKELEAEMSNTAEWEQRPAQERQERTRLFHSQENIIRIDMKLAMEDRKSLSLKDPEKYEFRPKQLLKQIVNIYVHLARGDNEDIFPAAITKDGRSYNDQLFTEAANVLRRIGEDPRIIQAFDDLDMLIPDTELKQKIEEFVRSQQRKQQNEEMSMQSSSKSSIQSPDVGRSSSSSSSSSSSGDVQPASVDSIETADRMDTYALEKFG